jgi:glyoxylase-like metal-dependent hydrolase (beta-lactamase superfamily II)
MSSPRSLTRVTDGVWVATSRNFRTASTIVANGTRAILVDPAWDPDELLGLAAAIDDLGLTITCGFHTHAHYDHLLWHASYGNPPRWATARTVEIAESKRAELRASLGDDLAAFVGDTFARARPVPGDRLPQPFGEDGPAEGIEVIVHDAHVPGHGALWFPERRLLVAADMLSDYEMPLPFDPDDLGAYLEGLERLAPYVERARYLITGHGAPTAGGSDTPMARLDVDRRLLTELMAGRDVDDPRRSERGGEETYARLKQLAVAHEGSVAG